MTLIHEESLALRKISRLIGILVKIIRILIDFRYNRSLPVHSFSIKHFSQCFSERNSLIEFKIIRNFKLFN